MKTILFAAYLIIGLVGVSISNGQHVNDDLDIDSLQFCLNSLLGDVPIGRVQCAVMEEEKQRIRMKVAYMSMYQTFSEAERSDLMHVQQIWSQWLEARCNFLNRASGAGSEANVKSALCRV